MSREEDIIRATIDGIEYDGRPQSRVEALLLELKETIEAGGGGGGGGTTNYNALINKPKINNIELQSNKTLNQLGIQAKLTFDDEPTEGSANPVKSSGIFSTFTALRAAVNSQMDLKVDKVSGKGLSSNDYTSAEKTKLTGIESGAEVNIIGQILVNGEALVPVNKSVAINVLTKAVDDLTNYYTKTQTYTKDEVNNLINSISALTLNIVEELPDTDISTTTIYLVPVQGGNNVYMQYAYINNQWAQLGTTQVDLTNYYTKAQVDTFLALKQDVLTFDTTPTANSENPVTSGGIKNALDTKEDTLQLDLEPIENSSNYLTSGVIFTALVAKLAEARAYTDEQIADFGGFEFADSIEDITNPNTKTIYLIKDYSATGTDKYREYVYKIVAGEGEFECIGDTSITLSPATVSVLGLVKPDGTTITIDADGTIHAAPSVEFDEEDFRKEDDLVSLSPSQRIFTGTQSEWNALSTAVRKTYGQVNITDDETGTPEYYSTTETKTNEVWIDGKPIYRIVFNSTSGTSSIDVSEYNVDTVITMRGLYHRNGNNEILNFANTHGSIWGIVLSYDKSTSKINPTSYNSVTASRYFVIFEYTKTTD